MMRLIFISHITCLKGEQIKLLHDHSVPLDLIQDLAEAHGIHYDLDEYHQLVTEEVKINFWFDKTYKYMCLKINNLL